MPTFINSVIKEQNGVYILTIEWGYLAGLWPWTWTETHILKTLEDCKTKLLQIRTRQMLTVITAEGKEMNLDVFKFDK